MSGALVVEGLLDPFPELRGLPEHVLLLKDAQIGDGQIVHREIGDDAVRTVNGMLNPTITLRPGETELWRIGNVGADLYYQLTLDGHRFYEVARDGHRLARLVPKRQLLLEPGERKSSCRRPAPGPMRSGPRASTPGRRATTTQEPCS